MKKVKLFHNINHFLEINREKKIAGKDFLYSLDNIEIGLTIGAIKQNLGSKLGLMQPRNAKKRHFSESSQQYAKELGK